MATMMLAMLLAVVGALATPARAATAQPDGSAAARRVLIVHTFGPHFEPFGTAATALRTELARLSPGPVEFFEVSLETARLSPQSVEKPLVDYVRALGRERPLDLAVPIGIPAVRFCLLHHEEILPGVPVVVAGLERRHLPALDGSADVSAVVIDVELERLVEDILLVRPETRAISVVIGNSPLDQYWVGEMQRAWERFAGRVSFDYLNDLTLAQMQAHVASLPPDAAVIFSIVDVDAAGVPYAQREAIGLLHAATSAPMFGLFDPGIGQGLTGGRVVDVHAVGVETARLALRVLGSESPSSIAPVGMPPSASIFDARELKRWGIVESMLPPGSVVRFRPTSAWENYRGRILLVGALCLLQAAMIMMLLRSRHRLRTAREASRKAAVEAQALRRELGHNGRVSLLGQVTTSLAHELGQPLGAIMRNADAGELYLENDPADLDEVRAILTDIRRDSARAAAVIDRLRALLQRRGVEMQDLAWGGVVDEVLGILRGDATARGIVLAADTPDGLPAVRGDRVQLQQVLINLVANALDSLEGAGSERRVVVRTRPAAGGFVECEVSDTGPGIAQERMDDLFEPFVTTKTNGMGMGLPISRTIVEAHGGRLWTDPGPGRGATFRFTVPAANAEAA
jgi:signal transduction histidine kinase